MPQRPFRAISERFNLSNFQKLANFILRFLILKIHHHMPFRIPCNYSPFHLGLRGCLVPIRSVLMFVDFAEDDSSLLGAQRFFPFLGVLLNDAPPNFSQCPCMTADMVPNVRNRKVYPGAALTMHVTPQCRVRDAHAHDGGLWKIAKSRMLYSCCCTYDDTA